MKRIIEICFIIAASAIAHVACASYQYLTLTNEVNFSTSAYSSSSFGTSPIRIVAVDTLSYAAGKNIRICKVSDARTWTTNTQLVYDYCPAPFVFIGSHEFRMDAVTDFVVTYKCTDFWVDTYVTNGNQNVVATNNVFIAYKRDTGYWRIDIKRNERNSVLGDDTFFSFTGQSSKPLLIQNVTEQDELDFSTSANGSSVYWFGREVLLRSLRGNFFKTLGGESCANFIIGSHYETRRYNFSSTRYTNDIATVVTTQGRTQTVVTNSCFILPGDTLVTTGIGDDNSGETTARIVYEY